VANANRDMQERRGGAALAFLTPNRGVSNESYRVSGESSLNVNNVSNWNAHCAGKGFKDGKALADLLFEKMRDKL
jgi:hypothetical protein